MMLQTMRKDTDEKQFQVEEFLKNICLKSCFRKKLMLNFFQLKMIVNQ